ncbi:MAG TPA: PAS domain S-box protein [Terriglobales bacterium]|nr:PAS domain S-box protein [Terriglobales bacterium]
MEVQPELASGEVKQLQRCINDLISLLALPAIWSGGDPSQVLHTLLDTLLHMLRLDLVSVRLTDPVGEAPVEIVRLAELRGPMPSEHEICEALSQCLKNDSRKWPPLLRNLMGEGDVSIVALPLGLQGELGVIVAAAERTDFPRQTEALLLSVAANQASIGLQEARLLSQQKRLASELDQRVVQRTTELAAANQELKRELAERRLVEEKLGQEERELKRSEVHKAAIVDSALDCIVTIDHEGCITEFNPAAEHTFGYRRDEVLGKHLADTIIPPSLREKHRQGFARYLATGEARVLGKRIEMTAVRADGSEFPVELAIARIPLEGPPSFTGYLRDITERKRAEQELRRSEAFLAEAQHLSRIGSFSWRVPTDEITWSEQLYRIFQIDQDAQVTFELIATRIHPEDLSVFQEHIERARRDGSDVQLEFRLQMPDGAVKYVHVVAHTRGDHGELEYIGAVQDVTERRSSEQALSRARSELSHVARVTSLGVLTASIAHEVNQPLSGIVTNASTCLRMLAADPPNVDGARETARRTIRDGNRASEVITRLRALYGKKEPTIESVDLNEATREVIALSLSELQRNRVILRPELADDLPPVTGDRVQLQQVILNLIRNGSDAMSSVDDRPRQLLIRTERDEGDRVRLTVQDAGTGFDPQAVDRLFEGFYTTKNDGMGIGLSVSRSIIESHHGHLWATLNEGPGAAFSFSIPRGPEGATSAESNRDIRTSDVPDAA